MTEKQEKWDHEKFEKEFDAAPVLSQSTFATLMTIKLAIEVLEDSGQKKDVCYAAMNMHTTLVVKNTFEALARVILETKIDPTMIVAVMLEDAGERLAKAARKSGTLMALVEEAVSRREASVQGATNEVSR